MIMVSGLLTVAAVAVLVAGLATSTAVICAALAISLVAAAVLPWGVLRANR
ncbi:MAG: hypothetical protein ACQSGP_21415 [Frankia sp.]